MKLLMICLCCFISCCGPTLNPKPSPWPPVDAIDCATACAKMQQLNCSEGNDVAGPRGTKITCTNWCIKEITEFYVPLNPSCIKNITNCNQIETTCAIGRLKPIL